MAATLSRRSRASLFFNQAGGGTIRRGLRGCRRRESGTVEEGEKRDGRRKRTGGQR